MLLIVLLLWLLLCFLQYIHRAKRGPHVVNCTSWYPRRWDYHMACDAGKHAPHESKELSLVFRHTSKSKSDNSTYGVINLIKNRIYVP